MADTFSRRNFLKATAGLSLAGVLAACGAPVAGVADSTVESPI